MIELTVQVGRALSVVTSTGDKIEIRCAKQGRSRKESLQQMLFVPNIEDIEERYTILSGNGHSLSAT